MNVPIKLVKDLTDLVQGILSDVDGELIPYDGKRRMEYMKEDSITVLKILSVILLLCSFLIPMFDIGAGLIPTEMAWSSLETVEILAEDGFFYAIGYWAVLLHLCSWVPGVILCIGAVLEMKKLATAGACLGFVLLAILGVQYVIHVESFAYSLGPIEGSFGIGYWLALILFLVCSIVSLKMVFEKDDTE